MRLIGLAVILAVSVILAPLVGEAQQAGPSKVGLLFLGTAGIDSTERSGIAVREGLRELGWVDNQNINFHNRYAGGSRNLLDKLASRLSRGKEMAMSRLATEPK